MEALLEKHPPQRFLDCFSDGFYFDDDFRIRWPASYQSLVDGTGDEGAAHFQQGPIVAAARTAAVAGEHPLSPKKMEDAYLPMTKHLLQDSGAYFRPDAFTELPDEKIAAAVAAKHAESAAAMAAGRS